MAIILTIPGKYLTICEFAGSRIMTSKVMNLNPEGPYNLL